MHEKIKELREEIVNNPIIKSTELFAGSNLIITSDKSRKSKTQDIIVFSDDASELSWLVFRLKDLFQNEIDYVNKYSFYTHIGELTNEAIKKELNLKEQMLYVIHNLGGFIKKST
jgi:hypothetical protein